MNNSEFFAREIDLINNTQLKEFVSEYLNKYAPTYFWDIGASSSGNYHPKFSQGIGGLVRHTKAVVMFAEELLRMSSYAYMPNLYKDYAIVACILHDTCKYGQVEFDKSEYRNHAENAAILVADVWAKMYNSELPFLLESAIKSHMGQWSTERDDRPFTQIDRLVHMADYMASRNFIDIPIITDEYNAVANKIGEE